MKTSLLSFQTAARSLAGLAAASALGAGTLLAQSVQPALQAAAPIYSSVDIVSDIQGVAHDTDPNLVNPWGLALGREGKLQVSDNGTGLASAYKPDGAFVSGDNSITIPQATVTSGTLGSPSGVVLNRKAFLTSGSNDFVISSGSASGPSHFLAVTEDGTVDGYNETVNHGAAIRAVDDTSGDNGYTGVTLSFVETGTSGGLAHRLYAANFRAGTVNVYDSTFAPLLLTGSNTFTDPDLPTAPAGDSWSPFNVKHIAFYSNKPGKKPVLTRRILVAYALHSVLSPMNDIPGAGNGAVAIFTPEGQFVRELVPAGGLLNSPWGLAIAHAALPKFRTKITILVGNHGDGQINAYSYDSSTDNGAHLGTLTSPQGNPLAFDGLWALHFGLKKGTPTQIAEDVNELGDDAKALYFTAGIVGETHGLLGRIVIP